MQVTQFQGFLTCSLNPAGPAPLTHLLRIQSPLGGRVRGVTTWLIPQTRIRLMTTGGTVNSCSRTWLWSQADWDLRSPTPGPCLHSTFPEIKETHVVCTENGDRLTIHKGGNPGSVIPSPATPGKRGAFSGLRFPRLSNGGGSNHPHLSWFL